MHFSTLQQWRFSKVLLVKNYAYLTYTTNVMAADEPMIQKSKASIALLLRSFIQNNPALEQYNLDMHYSQNIIVKK